MARRKADCTELEQAISDVALTIGMRQGMTIDGIVAEMRQKLPWINRDMVTESIVAANRTVQEELTEAQKQMADVKHEARVSEQTKKAIEKYEQALKQSQTVEGRKKKDTTSTVQLMREARKSLAEDYRRALPMKTKRAMNAQEVLQKVKEDIEKGVHVPKKRLTELEMYPEIKDILDQNQSLRDDIKNTPFEQKRKLRRSLELVERDLKSLREGTYQPRQPKERQSSQDPELEAIYNEYEARKDEKNQIIRNETAVKRLQAKADEYRKHLKDGTLPEPMVRQSASAEIEALREINRQLAAQIRNSTPAKAIRIKQAVDKLDEKEQKIISGSLETAKQPSEYDIYPKLERALFERDSKRRKINGMIRAMKPLTFWQKAAEPFNFSRALITSIDFSALLRQGGFIAFSHPIRTMKKVPRMFHVFFDKDVDKVAYEIESEAMNDPRAPLMLRFKLHQSALDDRYGLAPQEERFATRTLDWFAKRFPKAAKWDLIKRSQLAYTVMLNEIRRDSFNAMADALTKNGDIMTQEEGMAIANYINIATGRGDLGDFEQAANLLNAYFFAPKYVVSRFQLASFNPVRKSWNQKRVRNMIVQEYVRYMAGIGSVIGLTYLAAMATADDDEEVSFGFDPRSSDFLKLRVGNTRLDFFSGLGQTVVLASRLATGETKSTQGGGVREIRGEGVGYGRDDAWDVKGRFERYKLNPLAGTAVNLATGKNAVGEEVTFWSTVYDLTIPLSNREIASAYQEHGFSRGTAMGIANLFGVGIQSYGQKKSEIRPLRPLAQR